MNSEDIGIVLGATPRKGVLGELGGRGSLHRRTLDDRFSDGVAPVVLIIERRYKR
jgi:hypothetical protein